MTDRNLVYQAVFVALISKDDTVLLHRRFNTGYMDGKYDFPSGHVERGESLLTAAVREAYEETGVIVAESDLELFHIGQFDEDRQYANYFFRDRTWQGDPIIAEPDRCDAMQFFDAAAAPPVAPATALALKCIYEPAVTYSFVDKQLFAELSA